MNDETCSFRQFNWCRKKVKYFRKITVIEAKAKTNRKHELMFDAYCNNAFFFNKIIINCLYLLVVIALFFLYNLYFFFRNYKNYLFYFIQFTHIQR